MHGHLERDGKEDVSQDGNTHTEETRVMLSVEEAADWVKLKIQDKSGGLHHC